VQNISKFQNLPDLLNVEKFHRFSYSRIIKKKILYFEILHQSMIEITIRDVNIIRSLYIVKT